MEKSNIKDQHQDNCFRLIISPGCLLLFSVMIQEISGTLFFPFRWINSRRRFLHCLFIIGNNHQFGKVYRKKIYILTLFVINKGRIIKVVAPN